MDIKTSNRHHAFGEESLPATEPILYKIGSFLDPMVVRKSMSTAKTSCDMRLDSGLQVLDC
jgi:hypothetical protein